MFFKNFGSTYKNTGNDELYIPYHVKKKITC